MSYLVKRKILRFVKNVILVNFCDPGLRFGELELDVAKATRSFAPYRDKFWSMFQDHWKTTCESEAEVLLFGFTQCLMMSPHGTDIEFLMVCAFLTEFVSYSFLKKKCYSAAPHFRVSALCYRQVFLPSRQGTLSGSAESVRDHKYLS
ncbi:hypothetical protein CEXT_611061 [Caerostris extrusa]|uniref:Uncharacterized protein n=1 Tax=Caerostris extrusa TaxID=172846 RepID=A0AAV4WIL5_CAEEX|nr:hypothetical protein CEXT_611061 [Caerostris extrusa]